jgi:hypothetical protein
VITVSHQEHPSCAYTTDSATWPHFQSGRHSRHHIVIVLALCIAAAATACSYEPRQEGRMSQSGSTQVATDQPTIDEALRFGGIVLPPSAKVLGVQIDKGIDVRYRLAIEVSPDTVPVLLSRSGFNAPLVSASGPFMEPVDGFDLKAATVVFSTDDSLPANSARRNTVFRRVAVDRSNPTKSMVYLWLFAT